ncbi:MAG: hypothetical protein AAF502_25670, partial [Bacteroidota bacterium]
SKDADGVIWIGTDGEGIIQFSYDKIRFQHHLRNRVYGNYELSSKDVWAILQDPFDPNILWLGSEGYGPLRYNLNEKERGAVQPFLVNSTIDSQMFFQDLNKIRALEKSQNTLFIGTLDGIYTMQISKANNKPVEPFHLKNGPDLKGTAIRDLLISDDGELWIASRNGLMGYSLYVFSPIWTRGSNS